ncbi:unnamed protein product [Phytophthora fragariaefolia]|uniref:Unnamed protein product n=1 Tax=Phytophthora fragariaefolia TaxID=1490495 RepID=A0A9W6X103_9STRA|nr:unnamed protein product [Phytophthora fragariaefolia]
MADVSAGHIALDDLFDGYLYTPVQDAEIATSVVQMQHASSLECTSNLKEGFIKAYRTDPGFRDNDEPLCPEIAAQSSKDEDY